MNLIQKGKKVLVTGGTGFLGAYFIRQLLNKELTVRVLVRNTSSKDLLSHILTLPIEGWEIANTENIEWVEGDLLDMFSIEDAMKGVDWVLHSAGLVSFETSDHSQLINVNYRGTENVVNAALHFDNIPLVYISSIAAIGRAELCEVIDEETPWKNSPNNSMYAVSKYMGEREVWRGMQEGLSVLVVNPAVILGVTNYNSGTGKFWKQIDSGLKFYTLGSNGFVDVRDVVNSTLRLVAKEDCWNQRFILSAENLSFKKFFELLAISLKKNPPKVAASLWMISLVWRIEWIKSKLTGKKSIITKESAKNATLRSVYSNQKVKQNIQYEFIPIEKTIKWVTDDYISPKK